MARVSGWVNTASVGDLPPVGNRVRRIKNIFRTPVGKRCVYSAYVCIIYFRVHCGDEAINSLGFVNVSIGVQGVP